MDKEAFLIIFHFGKKLTNLYANKWNQEISTKSYQQIDDKEWLIIFKERVAQQIDNHKQEILQIALQNAYKEELNPHLFNKHVNWKLIWGLQYLLIAMYIIKIYYHEMNYHLQI